LTGVGSECRLGWCCPHPVIAHACTIKGHLPHRASRKGTTRTRLALRQLLFTPLCHPLLSLHADIGACQGRGRATPDQCCHGSALGAAAQTACRPAHSACACASKSHPESLGVGQQAGGDSFHARRLVRRTSAGSGAACGWEKARGSTWKAGAAVSTPCRRLSPNTPCTRSVGRVPRPSSTSRLRLHPACASVSLELLLRYSPELRCPGA
jgi:hypothetical protein